MAVVLVTVYSGVTLNTDITKGVSDRFRSLPIWRPAPIVGRCSATRGATCSRRPSSWRSAWPWSSVQPGLRRRAGGGGARPGVRVRPVVGLDSARLGAARTELGLQREPGDHVPLTLASNVFADPRTMPGWLRAYIGVNPITHVVTAVRGLMDGTATAGQIGWVLLAAAALTAVFAPSPSGATAGPETLACGLARRWRDGPGWRVDASGRSERSIACQGPSPIATGARCKARSPARSSCPARPGTNWRASR